MRARIAITGLGAVSALGADVPALLAGLRDGRSGIGSLTLFAHAGRCQTAAQVPEGVGGACGLPAATARRLSRPDRFALAAASEACRNAGLDAELRGRAALHVGATTGGMFETEEVYRRREGGVDRRYRLSRLLGTPLSTAAAAVSQALGIYGPQSTVATACSSSALAIAMAAATIRRGDAPVAIAIGTDSLCRLTFAGFDALQALDTDRCRPFDRARRGLTLGEGGAAMVLENADHARARGARVRVEVVGWGTATDAHHPTAPHPDGAGARAALHAALACAELSPDAIDYVNAHGTGTPRNDAVEVDVLRAGLGARAGRVPVSSSKSQLGHCLGAAGALEAVVTVLALADGVLPPTVGLRQPEWADLDFVPVAGRRASLGVALSSSYGFGGHNVTLVLARADR